jgi:hypothetical protein
MGSIRVVRVAVEAAPPGQAGDRPDDWPDREPSAVELAAIDAEMPLIRAEVELLDVRIGLMDRPRVLSELDVRRLRRAERRLLAERARFTRRTGRRGGPGVTA